MGGGTLRMSTRFPVDAQAQVAPSWPPPNCRGGVRLSHGGLGYDAALRVLQVLQEIDLPVAAGLRTMATHLPILLPTNPLTDKKGHSRSAPWFLCGRDLPQVALGVRHSAISVHL